jgi:hypothetical protein
MSVEEEHHSGAGSLLARKSFVPSVDKKFTWQE